MGITTEQDIRDASGCLSDMDYMGGNLSIMEFDHVSNLSAFNYCELYRQQSWRMGSTPGFNTPEQTREAVQMGKCPEPVFELYSKMREAIEPTALELLARMPSAKRMRMREVFGDELNIDSLATGSPEHWERRKRGQKKLTVRMGINLIYSAGTGEKEFVRGAVRGIALADVLTRLGHAVEISAIGYCTKHRKDRYAIIAPIKKSEQPMDPQSMLVCCLPGLSRNHAAGALDVYGAGTFAGGGRSTRFLFVDVVGAELADLLQLDVFAAGEDYRYMGPDSESHIAKAVSMINAAVIAPISTGEIQAMESAFAELTGSDNVPQV